MYNGGIFGGGPTGPLGVGVPSGWGNVDDTDEDVRSLAQQLVKERAKVPKENQSDETRRMRNRFLSWSPRNRTESSLRSLMRGSVGEER